MVVVDASALLEVLLQTPAADPIADRIFAPEESLHAPHLVDVEVAQLLRRYYLNGELDDERAEEAFSDLRDLAIDRYPHAALLARIWELRQNLTAYDATYLALAEALEAPVVTCDGRLSRSAKGLTWTEVEHFQSSTRSSVS